MASSSPVHISGASQNSSRTGLVTNSGSGRSYGTVKESPNLFLGSGIASRYCIHHSVEEEDTLQGLALKYNVTIQQIRRMNNLWNTDSLHIRPILKIPVPDSNESSRSGSPVMSSQRRPSNGQLSSLSVEKNHHKNRTVSSFDGHSLEENEEVRSKNSSLSSRHAECDGEGVKSIAGIFSSADEQLILARQFADKLALRCAERAPPEGAYNRTADMKNHLSSSSHRRSRSPSPSPFSSSSTSSQQGWGKKVKQSTEIESETRERVESQLFEL